MFCSKCGAQYSDDAKFCGNCGNTVAGESNNQQVNYQPQSEPNQLGMTFYKILIYLGLPFSILSSIFLAIQYFTGSIYANSIATVLPMNEFYELGIDSKDISNIIYAQVDGLKEFDMLWGFLHIAIAIIGANVWYHLKNFKKKSLSLCIQLYAMNMCVSAFQTIMMCVLFETVEPAGTIIYSIVIGVISICIIHRYLSNRKHLFIN